MLAKLRETGNKTPVIMLTSESKRAVVSGAVKLGIEDYILKPFKPDELRAKVQKVLGAGSGPVAAPTAPAAVAAGSAAHESNGQRQFIDVLVIDDMENVHKKLRSLLPQHISMNACASARDAIQHCQDRSYRIVLIDTVIPDVNSQTLMHQLRVLQPQAVMLALALRSANDATAELKGQGYHDIMLKPFDTDAVHAFLSRHFESNDVITLDGNVLSCATFDGKEAAVDKYFNRLKTVCKESLEKLASACYEESILDLSGVSPKNSGDKLVRFVAETDKEARKLGMQLRLVGKSDLKQMMGTIMETASLPFFASVNEARAAGA
jgi:two-component system, cell cycle response regulator